MVQVVIVVVYLRRGELSLVDDVFAGQRTNVKPFGEGTESIK
jgi:hypothetical protein